MADSRRRLPVLVAGVDPAVAMRISGHHTDATFRRLQHHGDADLRDAITKTTDYVSALPKDRKVTALPWRRAGS